MIGEQRLVAGDHRFAGAQACRHQIERDALGTADQLDHEIDLGIIRQ